MSATDLPPSALFLPSELKRECKVDAADTKSDDKFTQYTFEAADIVEQSLGLRALYRGKVAEVLFSGAAAAGGVALAGMPGTRTLALSTTATTITVTLTGVRDDGTTDGQPATDVITVTSAAVERSLVPWRSITSAVASALTGAGNLTVTAERPYNEIHQFPRPVSGFHLTQRPLVWCVGIYEASSASKLDTASYQFDVPEGYVERLSNPGFFVDNPEDVAFRMASAFPRLLFPLRTRVVHVSGYNRQTLPSSLKRVALEVGVFLYREWVRGEQGVQGRRDAAGDYTRYQTTPLTKDMMALLDPFRARPSVGYLTEPAA